ncbi:MAG: fluoride efflux transporter CrcB [Lachnospiraceae bacterium]|nr:fluoride efflux transporter CrcB [Lachnospiraceae bacterium]
MIKVLYVGIGGCIGSMLRYFISFYAPKLFGSQLPYGTLIVNVVGGVLIGFLMDLCMLNEVPHELRLFLTTGIIGGFTTFSTFSYETVNFFYAGDFLPGFLNMGLNLFLGFGGVILGKVIFNVFNMQ